MQRRRIMFLLAYLTAAAVLIAGVVVYAKGRDTTTKAAPPAAGAPLAPQPFPVSLSTAGPKAVPAGTTVPVGISTVSGRPIASVQLWDGAQLVATETPPVGSTGASFSWPAMAPGPHELVARAADDQGAISEAPPVAIHVANPTSPDARVPVPLRADDTLAIVAARYGVDPKLVTITPPAGATPVDPNDLKAKIVAGSSIVVQPAPSEPDADAGSSALIIASLVDDTGSPNLDVQADGCSVTVTAHGHEMRVDRGSTGQLGFQVADPSLADGSSITFPHLPVGTYVFEGSYIGAVLTIAAHTDPVEVHIPLGCAAESGWTGDVFVSHGILYLPKALGRIYAYIEVNGGDRGVQQRIPLQEKSYLQSTTPEVDISNLLPAFPAEATTAHVEVWAPPKPVYGAQATKLYAGDATLPAGESIADFLGNPSAIDVIYGDQFSSDPSLYVHNTPVDQGDRATYAEDKPVNFIWRAASPLVTHVIWQVLDEPLSPNNTDLFPPGLIAYSRSNPDASLPPWVSDFWTKAGTFQVVPDKVPTSTELTPGPDGVTRLTNEVVAITPSATPPTEPTYGTPPDPVDGSLNDVAPPSGGMVYIRALAMGFVNDGTGLIGNGEVSLGLASRAISLTLPPRPSNVELTNVSTVLTPGSLANSAYSACVRVTAAPWVNGGSIPPGAEDIASKYPQLGTYCPSDFPNPPPPSCNVLCQLGQIAAAEFGEAVDGLTELWDYVANAYNGIVNKLVEIIAVFNPVCLAMGAVDASAGQSCDDVAKKVTHAVVAAVLSGIGLPPTLPTSAELLAIAKGDLTQLAVSYMDYLGIPCADLGSQSAADAVSAGAATAGVPVPPGIGDPCAAMAGELLDEVQGQITQQTDSEVATATGLPDASSVPGFVMIPEPTGHISAGTLTVQAKDTNFKGAVAPRCGLPYEVTIVYGYYLYKQSELYLDLVPGSTNAQGGEGQYTGSAVLVPIVDAQTDGYTDPTSLHYEPNAQGCFAHDKSFQRFDLPIGPPQTPPPRSG